MKRPTPPKDQPDPVLAAFLRLPKMRKIWDEVVAGAEKIVAESAKAEVS